MRSVMSHIYTYRCTHVHTHVHTFTHAPKHSLPWFKAHPWVEGGRGRTARDERLLVLSGWQWPSMWSALSRWTSISTNSL